MANEKNAPQEQTQAQDNPYLNYNYASYEKDGVQFVKTPLRVIRKKRMSDNQTYLAYKILNKAGKWTPATFGEDVKKPDKPCIVHFRNDKDAWYWADNSKTPHVVILDVEQFEALVGNFAVEEFKPLAEKRKELF